MSASEGPPKNQVLGPIRPLAMVKISSCPLQTDQDMGGCAPDFNFESLTPIVFKISLAILFVRYFDSSAVGLELTCSRCMEGRGGGPREVMDA